MGTEAASARPRVVRVTGELVPELVSGALGHAPLGRLLDLLSNTTAARPAAQARSAIASGSSAECAGADSGRSDATTGRAVLAASGRASQAVTARGAGGLVLSSRARSDTRAGGSVVRAGGGGAAVCRVTGSAVRGVAGGSAGGVARQTSDSDC